MAVDFPGLRQNESSSQIINQAQDFLEQASRHGNLRQLERDVPAMADHFSTDLDQLLPECRQRPVLDLLQQHRLPVMMQWTAPTRRHLGTKMVVFMNHREIGADL